MKVIKASELGVYLYCKRAWAYQQQGKASQNQAEMDRGTLYHRQHGNLVTRAGIFKTIAFILLILAAAALFLAVLSHAAG